MTQTATKPPEYLTPELAAEVAGMSRPAFLKHVAKGNVKPDAMIGKRAMFLRATIIRWSKERIKNGAKKRGYPPKNGSNSKSRKES